MAISPRDMVRKLMVTAQNFTDQGNEEAAQTYAEKAAALAVKFGVEELLNESFDDIKPTIIIKRITVSNPYPKHRINLLAVIAKHQSCKVLKSGRNGAELFGDERDVERVMFIYRLISAHMLDGVSKYRPELPARDGDKHWYFKKEGLTPAETKSARVSWVIGYVSGIAKRMELAYREAVQEAKVSQPGAALVLADRRALAEKLVTETYSHVKRGTASKVTNADAFFAGKATSAQADMGQTRVGGERKALGA